MPDLPELTAQEMEFVLGMEEGLDQTSAYKKAYGAEGYSRASLTVRACKKAAEPRIKAWRQAFAAEGFNRGLIAREDHVKRLRSLAARAEQAGNFGAAVNAEVNAGKAEGHYIEKREDVSRPVADRMEQLRSRNPKVAEMVQALLDGQEATKH